MFTENGRIIRAGILVLFIIAMLGPWVFEQIFVPAEYWCTEPWIRLEDDSCGHPMSGLLVFFWFLGGFFSSLARWVQGTFTGQAQELLAGLYLLIILPFFTTLFLIWRKETRRLRTINLVAWILALIPTLTIFVFQINNQVIRLWGLWLYILAAVSAIIFEVGIQLWERRSVNKT